MDKWIHLISHKGYLGIYNYDEENGIYHGKIAEISDLVTFEGRRLSELTRAFKSAVDDYIEFKKEVGKK